MGARESPYSFAPEAQRKRRFAPADHTRHSKGRQSGKNEAFFSFIFLPQQFFVNHNLRTESTTTVVYHAESRIRYRRAHENHSSK